MTAAKGRKTLINSAKYLAETYAFREQAAIKILSTAYDELQEEQKSKREGIVRVYRQQQVSMVSPCQNPLRPATYEQCEMCAAGKVRKCQRQAPAEPAFTLTIAKALIFVRHGLAKFIDGNAALRLTFSRIAQLRDMSLKINERFLLKLVDGDPRAMAAIAWGWTGHVQAEYVRWSPAALAASRAAIQCFS